jgi:hypothetical protein
MRVANSLRQFLGLPGDLHGTFAAGAAARCCPRRLESQRSSDAKGLARFQGQQEMATLKISTADKINCAQTRSDSETSIKAHQLEFRYLALFAFCKLQPTHPNLEALQ